MQTSPPSPPRVPGLRLRHRLVPSQGAGCPGEEQRSAGGPQATNDPRPRSIAPFQSATGTEPKESQRIPIDLWFDRKLLDHNMLGGWWFDST